MRLSPPARDPRRPHLPARFAHYGGFTLGGLQIDAMGRVLSDSGEPLPGRFAAGRGSARVARRGYRSGLSLGDARFFGRRAGLNAALR